MIELEFFPWFRKKWKNSTRGTTEERIRRFLIKKLEGIKVRDVRPWQLQQVLEDAADEGFVKNTVSHVRWDMNQVFRYAVSIGILQRNPAEELFIPRRCSTTEIRVMTLEHVNLAQTVLPLRERLIFKLGVIAGMRPGEIFALRRRSVQGIAADIRQRIYKGDFASLARSRRSSFIFAVQRSVRFLAPTNAFASSPLVDHLPSRSKGEYGPHVQTPQREFEFAAGTRGRVSQRPLNSIAGEAVKTSAACPERTHSRFRA